ncbi:parallel beta-helix repeat (two copies) [Paenibacillus tianmuensis]|uniref:Parallel beta-helix repeat (Two copies) n=1 Tax=Paenibacillus tianmuensis TaxID=624147 RepID=A0A1G4R629_9BACL|nr:right-handed parallel beta-helix repeat-containing protein [Paenibacillus tianmuensis]SCW52055.1 parallel beta-helix repeat (two copies) [Paenibacillus tianmuensis]
MVYTLENVRDLKYGALGNGAQDDAPAIQKALDAVAALGGGVVYLPQGTYNIGNVLTLKDNTKLLGTGKGSIIVNRDDTNRALLQIKGNDVTVEDLMLEYSAPSNGVGIDWGAGATHSSIRNCLFTGITAQGINMNQPGIKHISITNCRFFKINYGVLVNLYANDLYDLRIIGNQFFDIYGDAIEINSPIKQMGMNREPFDSAHAIIISGNYISCPLGLGTSENSGFGIGIAGATRVSIVGNVLDNCRQQGIHIEDYASHIVINGNTIYDVGSEPNNGTNSGIYVLDGDFITINGNSIYRCDDYGIQLDYNSSRRVHGVSLASNLITDCGSGILISGGGFSDFSITDNIVMRNSGHGLIIVGEPIGIKVTGNTFRSNGAYGIVMNKGIFLGELSGNSLYGNKAGAYQYTSTTKIPLVLGDQTNYLFTPITGNYTPWVNVISLGKVADGLLYCIAKSGTQSKTELHKIQWDGLQLNSIKIKEELIGTIELMEPRINGNNLQLQVHHTAANGTNIQLFVQFFGKIMFA